MKHPMQKLAFNINSIFEQVSVPTQTPEVTMPTMIEFFKKKKLDALGIACFGPVELDRKSPVYGHITTTPKLAWRDFDIVGSFQKLPALLVSFFSPLFPVIFLLFIPWRSIQSEIALSPARQKETPN